jgi:hypothetical protein
MATYQIKVNGVVSYVSASSRKAAMLKKFGVAKVSGVEIKKVSAE